MELVVGVDAGGTSTRAVVADLAGHVVGRGTAAGLNQRSSGGDPVGRLVAAVDEALGGVEPASAREGVRASVGVGVLGVAGAGAAGHTEVARQAAEAWRRLGLVGDPVVVPDLLVAFAAGSAAADGAVLIGGTGAGAAAVRSRQVVRQADGAGWLLGDVGSAVWLAREALVAVVAALDGRGLATGLTTPLLAELLGREATDGTTYDVQAVIAGAYAVPPAGLGVLAPVVTTQAAAGDPVARAIVDRGVSGLLASLAAVADPARVPHTDLERVVGHTPREVVLAGALLTAPGPVRDGVVRGLAERGLAPPRTAVHPAAGAAWLALVSLGVTNPAVHARLGGG